jgi:hypothetical protein
MGLSPRAEKDRFNSDLPNAAGPAANGAPADMQKKTHNQSSPKS